MSDLPEELFNEEKPKLVNRLHFMLQGFYRALSNSICDPICVPSGIQSRVFGKMFYDCADNEERAEAAMKVRLETAGDDIKHFISRHEEMYELIRNLEEQANRKNTENTLYYVREFSEAYKAHIKLIKRCREKLEAPFLDFPSGQVAALSKRFIGIVDINPDRDFAGAVNDVLVLDALVLQISESGEEINFGEINTTGMPYLGSGTWLDTSYLGRIEFVKGMLQKLGIKFESKTTS